MLLSQDSNQANFLVTAYEPGRIEVNKKPYSQPLILNSNSLISEGLPAHVGELTESHVAQWAQMDAEIILLGMGATFGTPPIHLLQAAMKAGKMLEAMDTRAASYTYMVLTSENRKVMAVLYP